MSIASDAKLREVCLKVEQLEKLIVELKTRLELLEPPPPLPKRSILGLGNRATNGRI